MADPQANAPAGPRTDVVIVGGGLAGLSCALALSEAGLGVTVIERDAAAGGRARSWADLRTGDSVDVGPHIFLSEYPNMLRLLDTLGTRQDVVWQSDRLITLLERGRPTVVPHSRWPAPLHLLPGMFRAPTVSLRDKLSNVRVSWFAMRMGDEDVASLGAMAADKFLRRMGVSERFIKWFWASAAIAIENVPLELCSAGALLRLYRHLIGHRGVRIGFPARGLGELFAPQAVARIEAADGRVLTRTAVRGFSGEGGAADGVVLADGTRVTARWCVAAVPPQDLGALLPAAWASAHAAFRVAADFRPSPYVSTYLWFARKLSRERFWARVWSPGDLNTDFYDLSNLRIGWEDRPSLIAAKAIYSHRADGLSDEEVIAATLRELADFLPAAARERPVHARVHRIAMAKHASHPGTERKRPPTATPIRGLFLAGDWVHTDLPASMESAVRSGWLAAEAVCAEAGRPRRLAQQVRPPDGIAGLVRRFAPLQRAGRTG